MDFKETVREIGKEPTQVITWDTVEKDLEKVINTRNKEYAESFRKARVQEARFVVEQYIKDNPQKEDEDIEHYKKRINEFAKDYIDQAPDEFMRNLRTYCHMGTALWNQLMQLNASFNDFKEVFLAVNEPAIHQYAKRHEKEIRVQAEEFKKAQEKSQDKVVPFPDKKE